MFRAISHALTILSWQENLGTDEMPPEWMWSLDEELEDWFDDVTAARKEKYGGGDSDDEPTMMTNDLARGRR